MVDFQQSILSARCRRTFNTWRESNALMIAASLLAGVHRPCVPPKSARTMMPAWGPLKPWAADFVWVCCHCLVDEEEKGPRRPVPASVPFLGGLGRYCITAVALLAVAVRPLAYRGFACCPAIYLACCCDSSPWCNTPWAASSLWRVTVVEKTLCIRAGVCVAHAGGVE